MTGGSVGQCAVEEMTVPCARLHGAVSIWAGLQKALRGGGGALFGGKGDFLRAIGSGMAAPALIQLKPSRAISTYRNCRQGHQ